LSIYRGSGGSGDASTDATINEVTELVQDANQYKNEAATSASNAATSASNAATSESNASTSETNASSSASDAATSETNAATSETNAASSATSASTSASNASTSATAAQTAQTAAETAQASAETAETNASASATSASSSASTATTQAGIATTKASEASTSATNAATSETNAVNSATSAATSETNAANSASTASTAASNASTSESNAITSETNAAASATSASSSASSASSSATSAAGSATTATTKASEASTSASNASTSETNATSSASSASTSATNAANSASAATSSATAAAASAANAAQSYDQFDDRYLGSKTSDPTLDNDGNALLTGALYFNSTASEMRIYDGGVWIPASSSTIETMDKYAFTATSGQTVFSGLDDNSNTLALTVGVEFVTLNGIVLEAGTDYTATTSSITLTAGASTGDELNVIAFGNFTVADVVSASSGGTFNGAVTFADAFTSRGIDDNATSTAMTLNSSGNVGIGTSSPGTTRLMSVADGDYNPAIQVTSNASAANWARLDVKNQNATGPIILYQDQGGSGFLRNENPTGILAFLTAGGTERMRINSSGNVGIGGFTTSARVRIHKNNPTQYDNSHLELVSDAGHVILGFHAVGATAVNLRHVRGTNDLQVVNSIVSGFASISASAFNVNSDYRIKENITSLTGAVDRIAKLPVHQFSFVEGSMSYNDGKIVDGFLAHEVQSVVPEAVTGEKDEVDKDGEPVLQSIDQSKLVPLLTSALQEAIGRIETLEAEVSVLKEVL